MRIQILIQLITLMRALSAYHFNTKRIRIRILPFNLMRIWIHNTVHEVWYRYFKIQKVQNCTYTCFRKEIVSCPKNGISVELFPEYSAQCAHSCQRFVKRALSACYRCLRLGMPTLPYVRTCGFYSICPPRGGGGNPHPFLCRSPLGDCFLSIIWSKRPSI
jgi:hypothetical protein